MLGDIKQHFSSILQPFSDSFNPLPATACLVDHTVVTVMLSPKLIPLTDGACTYMMTSV